jgi:RNA 2',3'-cyclic 3'-phosphodiesterase
MQTKRLFFGTFIDSTIFQYIFEELQSEFSSVTQGKWVEPDNLHFTYQFLGDTDVSIIPEIKYNLGNYLKTHNSGLLIQGLGVFPKIKRANVLFTNIYCMDKIIFEIQKQIEKVMQKFGFQPEKREFTPHLTLQRIKKSDTSELKILLDKYKSHKFGYLDSFSVDLIESKLTPKGPIYSKI